MRADGRAKFFHETFAPGLARICWKQKEKETKGVSVLVSNNNTHTPANVASALYVALYRRITYR